MNFEPQYTARGFTLVEVLIALTIVAFGLIAVFGQLNQSAIAASRLRDKTFAHWIAMNLLTERRLLSQVPGVGTESDDIEMANARWHFEIRFSDTGVEGMRRADVSVGLADEPERPLVTASGFLMERPPGSIATGSGWPLVDPQAAAGRDSGNVPATTAVPVASPDAENK
jgi:general secretion pathway protein I